MGLSVIARYYFKPALGEFGIAGLRWHDFRHFYASVCAAAGIEIRKVSRWIGHANINTTDSAYTQLLNASYDEDMDCLDATERAVAELSLVRVIGA